MAENSSARQHPIGGPSLLDAGSRDVTGAGPSTVMRLRWWALTCAALMPIGVHVSYKMTGGLEEHLIKDGFNPKIDHEQYGLLNSAVSWTNLVLPFFAGTLLDARSTRVVAVLASLTALVGQAIFTVGVYSQNFPFAVAGRFVFGAGEGSIMIAQGAMCFQWFHRAELTFAFGICEMTHNMANFVGKIAVNVGLALGGWRMTLWFALLLCVFGFVVSCVFVAIEAKADASGSAAFVKHGTMSCNGFKHLRIAFLLVLLLHMLVSNVEHLFDTISAEFVKDKWHTNTSKAAWLSAQNYILAIGLSPLVGLFLDATKWRMAFAAVACSIMGGAHTVLGLTQLAPAIGLTLLSVPEAVLPTILRSCVPLVVRPSATGLAFGLYEIAESLGKTAGAPLIGYIRDKTQNYTADEVILVFASVAAAVLCLVISCADWCQGGALNAGLQERRAQCEQLRLQDITETAWVG